MLVPEGGGHKVLLTSTVFPVSGVAVGPAKPRFRLLGKRSSDFATRVVAASVMLPCDNNLCGPRLTVGQPGGVLYAGKEHRE